ncbi:3-methyladenine DNA glycosylase [Pseudaestuariivita atlantica]|uniref:DNA-3-methyladenine glycosylase II n=1 Tax=Pseudaestuariivita atlantica TaxID=1317121 RepID=A0A0L1JMK9_9RHOB|nr:3-methyladenine DNA glycosylase [Pseudaestuariivita atlantica]
MAWLRAEVPVFVPVLDACGDLPLRRRPDGFAQVLSAIVSQQVSVASAAAIWGRLEGAGMVTPEAIWAASDDALRGLGLSRQKVRYARALAEAGIDFDGLRSTPTDRVIDTLTQVSGIGTWTAEIYAMFSLGRADVFAHGDLALQEGARLMLDLPERPGEREMRAIAEDWAPWRSVAARALWAYYRVAKNREGVR